MSDQPLRKTVETEKGRFGEPIEVLECGHRITPPLNIHGEPRPAKRRICWKCARGERPDYLWIAVENGFAQPVPRQSAS